jgi:hypothetical protein
LTIINNEEEKVEQEQEDSKQRIKWEWNNKTRQSYIENGVSKDKIPRHVEAADYQVKQFLSKVDHKGKFVPVRSVTKIVRIKATDWDTEHQEQKDYLYWYENWYGKDWLGRDIAPVTDHVQGVYEEILMKDKINDYGDVEGRERNGSRTKYYVPFSKEAVDKIIATSDNTDKNNISFVFKSSQMRTGDYTYEQFCNSKREEMDEIARTPGGPSMFDHYQKQIVKERQEKIRNKQYG